MKYKFKCTSCKNEFSSDKSGKRNVCTPCVKKAVASVREPRILHLTLKKQWFDLIASGKKREEYREIKPYWTTRLVNKGFDVVRFRNGYSPESPVMDVEFHTIRLGFGKKAWGAQAGKKYFVISLGKVISKSGCES